METLKEIVQMEHLDKISFQQKFQRYWNMFTIESHRLYKCDKEEIEELYNDVYHEVIRDTEVQSSTFTNEYLFSLIKKYGDRKLVIKLIQEESEQVLISFYDIYCQKFIRKAQYSFGCPFETAKDLFQDTLLDFWSSIITGRLLILTTNVENYLYNIIYRKKLINWYNRNKRWFQKKKEIKEQLPMSTELEINWKELTDRQEKVQWAMKQLSKSCQDVLKFYYYKGYAMDAVARELDYNNKRVAITKKSKCLDILIKKIRAI